MRILSEQDICELFDLVAGLEALAGRLACESITDKEIADVETLHHEMYASYMRRDMQRYFRISQTIHRAIVAADRNQTLSLAYAAYTGQISRVRYSAKLARRRDRWGEAMREHEDILDALRQRDGIALSQILFLHLGNKRTAAVGYLNDPEQETG